MHIPDGFLSNTINLTTIGISGGVMALTLKKARQEMTERKSR